MSKITIVDMKFEHYNHKRGFFNENIKWYQRVILLEDFESWTDIINWIYNNIENPERHSRWYFDEHERQLYVKFRKERDFMWFALRW